MPTNNSNLKSGRQGRENMGGIPRIANQSHESVSVHEAHLPGKWQAGAQSPTLIKRLTARSNDNAKVPADGLADYLP
jgi:hypothetical protein